MKKFTAIVFVCAFLIVGNYPCSAEGGEDGDRYLEELVEEVFRPATESHSETVTHSPTEGETYSPSSWCCVCLNSKGQYQFYGDISSSIHPVPLTQCESLGTGIGNCYIAPSGSPSCTP
ncbi:MAG: hypothetical protein KDD70_03065 [Bdellovibrionales bacterium]|nr:hypothetical protein [Bdellovibrionales bacterium]